jgi:hypothetical protein
MKLALLEMACFWHQSWTVMAEAFSKTVLEQMLPSVKNVIAMCS